MNRVILKQGRDRSVRNKHPWIFSGAIESIPDCFPGTILPVFSHDGEFLAQGYFNPQNSLAGRIFAFEVGKPKDLLAKTIKQAYSLRQSFLDLQKTTAYRLINGEGDGIPGLIIDIYGEYAVLQIHTYGLESLREFFVDQLCALLPLKGIYEKSLSPSRLEENLQPMEKVLFGDVPEQFEICENGIRFLVSPSLGQKTGFFLDQRTMRSSVRSLAKGKKVLSLFSYTGSFGIYALQGGATHATSVDSSKSACDYARKNTLLNELKNHTVIEADAFSFLEESSIDQDLVLIDPPAFAKKKRHQESAYQAYRGLNALALSKMKPNSILMTSSCSYFMDYPLFEKAISQAALQSRRMVQILGHHLQAVDHPTSLFHPEGTYLKSLLLFVH